MKQTYILLMAAAALTLGACTHKTHFEVDMPQDEQTDKYPAPNGRGFLGNDLTWEDVADFKSDITHLKFTVSGSNGVKEVHEFNSPEEASEWMIPLPVGEYRISEKASNYTTTYTGIIINEGLIASNPARQAWNGIARVTVEDNRMATVHLDLDRLLALFTLTIKNVPEGTSIDVTMRGAASYVTLTDELTAGHWGLPCEEISEDIVFEQLNAANAASAIDEFKVFPTAKGQNQTLLFFHIRTREGLQLDYKAEAPRMENGKKYVLDMDFGKLSPYMLITAMSINDWTDGWAISGEILNPSN